MSLRILVTGATGYLGGAIAMRLARAGHQVQGLTRSAERGTALVSLGVDPVIGHLNDPDSYLGALKNCDAIIHAAIDPAGMAAGDRHALDAIKIAVQDGRVRRVLYTSGVWVHGDTGGRVIDESAPLAPVELMRWRAAHEDVVLDLAVLEAAVVVFRPGIVYGESRGLVGQMFAEAREKRTVTTPGDGRQHWPLVHRADVAEAYALALEHAKGGDCFILADESLLTVREIAEAIARVTGAQARVWTRDEMVRALGAYGEALLTSQKVTSAKARRELGWVPRHTSLVHEVGALYQEWQSSQRAPVG